MPINKKRLIYVISNINNSLGFEWLAEDISKDKYDVTFVFLHPRVPDIFYKIESKGVKCHFIRLRGKKDLPLVLWKLFRFFSKSKPEIVHCHLFEASLVGLTAAYLAGVPQRIYTRHHSTLHHIEHPSVVKYDRWNNRMSTSIVAVTKMVANVLIKQEGVKSEKVSVIHHGFHLDSFFKENISVERIDLLRNKYNPDHKKPVIGVISRFVEWKGVQYIIPAFRKLLLQHPDALLILANAQGNYADELKEMLDELPAESYKLISFENDIFALYQLFTVFVHVPVRNDAEAFGQIYIESLAAGVAMICTDSGIGPEVAVDGVNALKVPYENVNAIYEKMLLLINDHNLIEIIRTNARASAGNAFSVTAMITKLEELYG